MVWGIHLCKDKGFTEYLPLHSCLWISSLYEPLGEPIIGHEAKLY
ncbi:hypothetical protein HMPREF3185_00739 [Porphyromonas somerae]|uniref:Uncharacterized protein n=1 Tax=Porphyromonas somerae TaxID=322095 RepID=A0A134BAM1_9PORP|nr:hypothetical protein HMPREF3184_00739 [Porphyromonadaceae bacterium KA00676]KXB76920.1 hypothetical protein HMPREF3185_00739 [Porphyromonas somerae]